MLKNLMTFVFTLAVSLAIGEVALRAFTPFPINDKSNKISDPDLGYRLRPNASGFDSHGFRNSEDKHSTYKVAAIGDSHTYGINVFSYKNWPSIFEQITEHAIYNYGVSSYGILTYHALVRKEIERSTKYIIVALYPANDFIKSWSHCKIDLENSDFWINEINRLNLDLQNTIDSCNRYKSLNLGNFDEKQFWRYFKYNSAFVSAMHHLVFAKFKLSKQNKMYRFPAGIPSVSVNAAAQHKDNVDYLSNDISDQYNNFKSFATDWMIANRDDGVKIGILLIPSKDQIVYRLLERKSLVDQADPAFILSVRRQDSMEMMLQDFFRKIDMPFQNASEFLVDAFEHSAEKNSTLYPDDDQHPSELGYRAYAVAAVTLWRKMQMR